MSSFNLVKAKTVGHYMHVSDFFKDASSGVQQILDLVSEARGTLLQVTFGDDDIYSPEFKAKFNGVIQTHKLAETPHTDFVIYQAEDLVGLAIEPYIDVESKFRIDKSEKTIGHDAYDVPAIQYDGSIDEVIELVQDIMHDEAIGYFKVTSIQLGSSRAEFYIDHGNSATSTVILHYDDYMFYDSNTRKFQVCDKDGLEEFELHFEN